MRLVHVGAQNLNRTLNNVEKEWKTEIKQNKQKRKDREEKERKATIKFWLDWI